MTSTHAKDARQPPKRQYLVQLLCVFDRECDRGRYIARIRPWIAHKPVHAEAHEHAFADEYELIATINPLLPPGSDVRDVFEHIESTCGFFYLLRLNSEEASQLGWKP